MMLLVVVLVGVGAFPLKSGESVVERLSEEEKEEFLFFTKRREVGRRLEAKDEYKGSKQPLSEVDPVRLGLASAIILIFGSLAAGAGIGGGGLFVPTYWLILGVGPKGAVPLSGATILGVAFGNFVSMGWQQHPRAKRPLIDYEVATFTQPGELLGVVFGVLLNILLPPICIIVLLALVLTYNARRTLRKGFSTRAKETKAINRKNAALAENDREIMKQQDSSSLDAQAVLSSNTNLFELDSIEARAVDNDDEVSHSDEESPRFEEEEKSPQEKKTLTVVAHTATDEEATNRKGNRVASLEITRNETEEAVGIVPSRYEENQKKNADLEAVLAMDAVQFPLWAYGLLFPMTA